MEQKQNKEEAKKKLYEIASDIAAKDKDSVITVNHLIDLFVTPDHLSDTEAMQIAKLIIDYYQYEVMNFCGCGCPEMILKIVQLVLKTQERFHTDKNYGYYDCVETYTKELHLESSVESRMNEIIIEFFLKSLDSCDLLDHGSGVSGSWLSSKGDNFLFALNYWEAEGYPDLDTYDL